MSDIIMSALKEIENNNNCKILFACESGSRAWGFPSQDSDFDIRFIFIRPVEAYLGLTETTDTINCFLPNELDLSGWDLKKSLVNFAKSNMPLYEWLGSPIVYSDNYELSYKLKKLISTYINLKKGCYHHSSLAIKKYNEFSQKNHGSIKKLFYVLRSITAALWIIKNETNPFTSLVENLNFIDLDQTVFDKIKELIQLKETSNESDVISPDPIIIDWVTHTLGYLNSNKYNLPSNSNYSLDPLNDIFLEMLKSNYSY
jgi:predicted nucleotidyltransferase